MVSFHDSSITEMKKAHKIRLQNKKFNPHRNINEQICICSMARITALIFALQPMESWDGDQLNS
jgi:hypothetical protein